MRRKNERITAIQTALILIISAAASYSLLGTNVLSFLPFIGLSVVGTVMIFFLAFGPALFSLLAALVSLPAILNYSMVDWIAIYYNALHQVRGMLMPTRERTLGQGVTFPIAVGLGLLIILGYLALSYFQSLQKDYRTLVNGQAEMTEVDEVINKNLVVIVLALIASVVFAAVVVTLLGVFPPALADYLKGFPWSIIIIGSTAVLLLAGFVYWVGVRGRE